MTDIEPTDWHQRLQAAVAETVRKRQAQRDERRETSARRDAGLERRHERKLAHLQAAAVVDPSGTRCRYLVSEEPARPCPNSRAAGAELCRPHLTRAVQLARRLGLIVEGE